VVEHALLAMGGEDDSYHRSKRAVSGGK